MDQWLSNIVQYDDCFGSRSFGIPRQALMQDAMPSFLSFNGSLLETIVVLQIIVIALLLVAPTVEQQNKQMKADEQERLSRVAASLERQRLEQAEADEWDRIRDVANREMDRLASPRRAAERRV